VLGVICVTFLQHQSYVHVCMYVYVCMYTYMCMHVCVCVSIYAWHNLCNFSTGSVEGSRNPRDCCSSSLSDAQRLPSAGKADNNFNNA
jgi:hypothetical protein